MGERIKIAYTVECACGMDSEFEIQDAANVIVVTPCPHCEEDRVKEYIHDNLKKEFAKIKKKMNSLKDDLDDFLDDYRQKHKL